MADKQSLTSLLQGWKELRSNGWLMLKDTDKLIEKHNAIEKAISQYEAANKKDAFLQLNFLHSLWWESIEHPAEGRDYVFLNTFSSVLKFLSSK